VAAAAAGAVAALAALAAGELVAGLLLAPSPVVAVGDRVVALAPSGVVRTAIDVLGTADRPALLAGIVVLTAGAGALLGAAATRRAGAFAAGLAAFGLLGVVAAAADPRATAPAALLPSLAAVLAGAAAFRALAPRPRPAPAVRALPVPAFDRRAFLRRAGILTGLAVAGAGAGRALQQRAAAAASRVGLTLPAALRPLPPVPAAAQLDVAGLDPVVTPNDRFYRIDTALQVPRVDAASWRLRVTGMVDRPLELSLDDLFAREIVEADVTLACVSNEVGGRLVGNARWRGVRLDDLLAEAGVRPGATQVVGRSVDGFTAGFPTATLDGRAVLVAVGMNGAPLPFDHGFPARLVVPGLYGYVSATKWLAEIELTTLEALDGYWIPRGWAKEAPIKTASRIDVPRPGSDLAPGRSPIAGVAWAPTRGIDRVEVAVDDGPWQVARLAAAIGPDSWRQWVLDWDATPGVHTLRVRATDGTGATQTEQRADPVPDGASGWHTVTVRVTS